MKQDYSKLIKKQFNNKSRILLIDEVDTFFSDGFYGKTYTISAMHKNEEIDQIMELIWDNRILEQ